MTLFDPAEGWSLIRPGHRSAHYYRGAASLCRRAGPSPDALDDEDKPLPGDCPACRAALDREKAAS